MPTFYEGKPIEIIEQSVSSAEWASAYYTAQSSYSLIHRKEIKAGACITAALLIGSIIPSYHYRFSTVWGPACGIFITLALSAVFYFVQPNEIRQWAEKLYRSNAILALPEKITVYRDSVVIENEREQFLEYWTDFAKCIETKDAFVITGGLERSLLTIQKRGMTQEQQSRLSAHFADAFASRYQRNR
jgi:hypothetical protein